MTYNRLKELLNAVLKDAYAGADIVDIIEELLSIGFTREELIKEFNFDEALVEVADGPETADVKEVDIIADLKEARRPLLEKGYDVTVHEYLDDKHKDIMWYRGRLATISKGNIEMTLFVEGDKRAHLYNEDGKRICVVKERNLVHTFYSEMSKYIPDDQTLHEKIDDETLQILEGNWIEWRFYNHETKQVFEPEPENVLDFSSVTDIYDVEVVESLFENAKEEFAKMKNDNHCNKCYNARLDDELTDDNDFSSFSIGDCDKGYRFMYSSGNGKLPVIEMEVWSEKHKIWLTVGAYTPKYCPECGREITEYDEIQHE